MKILLIAFLALFLSTPIMADDSSFYPVELVDSYGNVDINFNHFERYPKAGFDKFYCNIILAQNTPFEWVYKQRAEIKQTANTCSVSGGYMFSGTSYWMQIEYKNWHGDVIKTPYFLAHVPTQRSELTATTILYPPDEGKN